MEFIKVRAKKSYTNIIKTKKIYYLKAGLVDLNLDGILIYGHYCKDNKDLLRI